MGMFLTILGVLLGAAGTLVERIQRKRDAEVAVDKVLKRKYLLVPKKDDEDEIEEDEET